MAVTPAHATQRSAALDVAINSGAAEYSSLGARAAATQTAQTKHGPINTWQTSAAKSMSHVFYKLENFNEDIGSWQTSSVTTFLGMFKGEYGGTTRFNRNINAWQTSSATSMSAMFYYSQFNQA